MDNTNKFYREENETDYDEEEILSEGTKSSIDDFLSDDNLLEELGLAEPKKIQHDKKEQTSSDVAKSSIDENHNSDNQKKSSIDENSDSDENADSNLASIKLNDDKMHIQIRTDSIPWTDVQFVSIAFSGIGLHIIAPFDQIQPNENLKKTQIRFLKRNHKPSPIIKQFDGQIRWQEPCVNGQKGIKLGVHFSSEATVDPTLTKIIKYLSKIAIME